MQYKTIVLGLLQSQPAFYRRLRVARRLLPVLESYAQELRDRHLAWTDRLARARPGEEPQTLRTAGLELALAELERRIAVEASPDGSASAP